MIDILAQIRFVVLVRLAAKNAILIVEFARQSQDREGDLRFDMKWLYHLAEADNLDSILKHGLMSTKRLVGMVNLPERERKTLLRNHRPECVRLAKGVLIRDQRPMPPTALSRALDEDLKPSDWYELLNGFVFSWPDPKRLERQRRACGDRPQILLTFDSAALFGHFGASAFVSPINSGNARRKAARRGLTTLLSYKTWSQVGWPTGRRTRPPVEVLFECVIPTVPPYLIGISII